MEKDDEMMSGFECYKTYLAVSQHFVRDSYDFFKYNGKTNAKESAYLTRRDKYFFEKASKRFKRGDFLKFLVANYVNNTSINNKWIGEMMGSSSSDVLVSWKKRVESLTYRFSEDISYLYDVDEDFNKLFMAVDGSHPLIYRHFAQGRISVETMVLLDKLVGFSKLWAKYDDIVLNDTIKLMKKYSPFLEQFSPTEKKKLKDVVLKYYK
jgi:hypothetical protein